MKNESHSWRVSIGYLPTKWKNKKTRATKYNPDGARRDEVRTKTVQASTAQGAVDAVQSDGGWIPSYEIISINVVWVG